MPELPEVEVCRLGISPHILDQTVSDVVVRVAQLRWPIPEEVKLLTGLKVEKVERRAKYLLIRFATGTLVLHLGMSGTIRIIDSATPVAKHDHFDLTFSHGKTLRLNDTRRFGAVLWFDQHIDEQGLLTKMGPEPLSDEFSSDYLFNKAKNRKVPIKSFLMNNNVVVGVGNIYANEALFLAGILPTSLAGSISESRLKKLTEIVKTVLSKAITQGGTTLKDFVGSDGKPGYFQQTLNVYDRKDQPCTNCTTAIKHLVLGQRSTYYCPNCQQ